LKSRFVLPMGKRQRGQIQRHVLFNCAKCMEYQMILVRNFRSVNMKVIQRRRMDMTMILDKFCERKAL